MPSGIAGLRELWLTGSGDTSGVLDSLAVWWHFDSGPGTYPRSNPGPASVPAPSCSLCFHEVYSLLLVS